METASIEVTSILRRNDIEKHTWRTHWYFIDFESRIHVEISTSNRCHNFHVDSPFKIDVISTNFPRGISTSNRWQIDEDGSIGIESWKSQLFKVTNTGKNFSNVCISLQLTKNDVKSLLIKITSKKVSKNIVHISTIEITSKKVPGNHVDFLTIEITSKNYAEMTWKFVEICSSTYRRNIHVESTWIRRGVPIGNALHQKKCFA